MCGGPTNALKGNREGLEEAWEERRDAYTPGLTWATVSIHSTSWLVRGAEQ